MSKQDSVLQLLAKYNMGGKIGGENIGIRCPLAPYTPLHRSNYDSKPSMGIKVGEGSVLVNCFTCQFKAGQLSYLFKRLAYHDPKWNTALQDCLDLENAFLGESLNSLEYSKKPKEKALSPFSEDLFKPYSRKFAPYLSTRGIELETGKRFDVGYDSEKKRAVIPVRDPMGRLWGAVGRTICGYNPKYLNYWEMAKGMHLLGGHLVESGVSLILVEGALDCMRVDQCLYKNGLYSKYRAVSIMGASITQNQVDRIVSWGTEVILAFDADEAGLRGSKKAMNLLSGRMYTKRANIGLVGKKDFGECTDEEILRVVDKSILVM